MSSIDRPSRTSLLSLVQEHPTNTILRGDSASAQKKFSKLIPTPQENIYKVVQIEESLQVPDQFEGKTIWKEFLSDVVDQKECGSCWAFAAVTSLADRFNIHSKGKLHLNLSPVPIVLCDTHGAANPEPLKNLEESVQLFESVQKLYGCNGNLLSEAWRMLYTVGTNEQTCMPLRILDKKTPSSCIKLTGPAGDMCSDYRYNFQNYTEYGTPAKFYTVYYVYAVPGTPAEGRSELDIRKEIYKFGPVSTAFELYPDFYTFDPKNGIYRWSGTGERISGHAIVIDGWGEENGVKFWWVRNSWGPQWGIEGYFKMIRGENHCKIEENVVTGIPNLKTTHYVIPENMFKNAVIPKDVSNKFYIHSYENMAGGIDPNTGYSRRIMSYLDNRQKIKDIDPGKVPTPAYSQFVAADVASTSDMGSTSESTDWIFYLIGGIVLVLLLVLVVWYYYRTRRKFTMLRVDPLPYRVDTPSFSYV
jgi:cathepsin B